MMKDKQQQQHCYCCSPCFFFLAPDLVVVISCCCRCIGVFLPSIVHSVTLYRLTAILPPVSKVPSSYVNYRHNVMPGQVSCHRTIIGSLPPTCPNGPQRYCKSNANPDLKSHPKKRALNWYLTMCVSSRVFQARGRSFLPDFAGYGTVCRGMQVQA